MRVEEQWDKVEKTMTEVAVETKKQKFKEWKKAEECEKDMKQTEYKASRNEAKRCIARVQAEVMKKQAETLNSKEGRQNIKTFLG